jgi:hypothetical protein
LDWLADQLQISHWEEWYSVTAEDFQKHAGATLLEQYHDSPSFLITSTYPHYPWEKSRFDWWQSSRNMEMAQEFMRDLGVTLDIKHWEQWYAITAQQVQENGGSSFLKHADNSAAILVCKAFPQYPWKLWKFNQFPKDTFDNLVNQREFMDWIGTQMGHAEGKQWVRMWEDMSMWRMLQKGGETLLGKYNNNMLELLSAVYPERANDLIDFQQRHLLTQNLLYDSLCRIWPDS